MTLTQLKKFVKAAKKKDLFWVAVGDNVLDEPQSTAGIRDLQERYPDWEICVLHQDHADVDGAPWSLLTEEEDEDASNPLKPAGPIQHMMDEVAALKEDLADTHRITEILREYVTFLETIDTRKAEFEERELYLQESEEALMVKAQELEVLRVELEQKQDHNARSA
ncbi:MAG: hypothetical protein AAFX93_09485 [Verrucomicrobiota bacterium]